jgi:pyridoxamine 5'-phosphate oxidase
LSGDAGIVAAHTARMNPSDFERMRREYGDAPLDREHIAQDPLQTIRDWMEEARAAGVSEPNAMALATCGPDGAPHCRIVLCKQIDARGVSFFTNYGSDKGAQLAANPRAAATYWWGLPRNRQVRIEGPVQRVPEAESDAYFASRPRQAQLASAASPQSRVLRERAELEQMVRELEQKVGDGNVPRPSHWGGYVIAPEIVEFWQGRDARLHDRLRCVRDRDAWRVERLAP